MNRSIREVFVRLQLGVLTLGLIAGVSVGLAAVQEPAARPALDGPPVPYEDLGACPFEGCSYTYREWTANAGVVVRTDRRRDAAVGFSVRAGEKVAALTGVVVTVKAGRAVFREPRMLQTGSGSVRIDPGETLYLLTYRGEGFMKVWLRGQIYDDTDTVDFYNGVCTMRPERCVGEIVEKSTTEWWVQLRTRQGLVGWTNEPEKFDGKDALSGEPQN
jgi:hypothetical protein